MVSKKDAEVIDKIKKTYAGFMRKRGVPQKVIDGGFAAIYAYHAGSRVRLEGQEKPYSSDALFYALNNGGPADRLAHMAQTLEDAPDTL